MFRQIPIEMIVGCSVILLTPVRVPGPGQLPIVEFIHSTVGKIKTIGPDKWIYAEDPKITGNYIKIPEWRIVRFTYGGIWLENYKFDQKRIDEQNVNIISQKNPTTGSSPKAVLGNPPGTYKGPPGQQRSKKP